MKKRGFAWILAVTLVISPACGGRNTKEAGAFTSAAEVTATQDTQYADPALDTDSISEEEVAAYEENKEVIVRIDSGTDVESLEASLKESTDKSLEDVSVTALSDEYALVSVDSGADVLEAVSGLAENKLVDDVQPNIVYQVQGNEAAGAAGISAESQTSAATGISAASRTFNADTLNDKYYEYEWWASGKSFTVKYNDGSSEMVKVNPDATMNLKEAWSSYSGKHKVTVAVIDTGIDITHTDLKGAIWTNDGEIADNGLDDDGNGYVDDANGWDFYWDDDTVNDKKTYTIYDPDTKEKIQIYEDDHGTHVAGIIAANPNNSVGIAGVAGNCDVEIMAVKALGGKYGTSSTAKLISAIDYASKMGADVVNASWAAEGSFAINDEALYNCIKNCGMLFVCAAGNEGKNLDTKRIVPACYSSLSNVITVGALEPNGTKASYSNYGSYVSLLAPGSSITSSVVGNKCDIYDGTSMAAPMVTGIAAMVYSYRGDLYPSVVKEYILSNTKNLSTISAGAAKIRGIPDANAIVTHFSALDSDVPEDKQAPTISSLKSTYKGVVTAKVADSGTGVAKARIAKGKRLVSYFKNGMKGSAFTGKYQVSKSGIYTVYACDYSGNEIAKSITVTVDKKAPNVGIAVKGRRAVITVEDADSGVSQVRYAKGKHGTSYFSSSGKKLKISSSNSKVTLSNLTKGTYTLFAKDKAGNKKVKTFTIK